jgi:hypothetical protein
MDEGGEAAWRVHSVRHFFQKLYNVSGMVDQQVRAALRQYRGWAHGVYVGR